MPAFDYKDSGYQIRADLPAAYRKIWRELGAAGNWWTGRQRIAVVAESRASRQCALCNEREAALSPSRVCGEHDQVTDGLLPANALDAVHRINTDAARLAKAWLENLLSSEFGYGHYVELLGVLVAAKSIDAFHEALGLPLEPLPEALEGDPSGYAPREARFAGAWVPVLTGEELAAQDADIYAELPLDLRPVPNVLSAMSLVPDAVRMLFKLNAAQYLDIPGFARFDRLPGRALNRSQVELVAARVSALNDCFY